MPLNSSPSAGAADDDDISPARKVVLAAEKANAKNGHELLGALSLTHGFMPKREPLTSLPPEFKEWDELAAKIPELHVTMGARAYMDAMPVLDAEKVPNEYVHRAGERSTSFRSHCLQDNPSLLYSLPFSVTSVLDPENPGPHLFEGA